MGFGKMGKWHAGRIVLTKYEINEKVSSKSACQRRVSTIPLFHHSIIPRGGQELKAPKNTFNFPPQADTNSETLITLLPEVFEIERMDGKIANLKAFFLRVPHFL